MSARTGTMKAAVVEGPCRAGVRQAELPIPGPGFVRVRMEGCGVCGSNLPAWEGRPWFKYPFAPGELGHEGWGWIDEVGPDVTRFKTGARVAVLSYRAYAEYDLAHENSVVGLPPALDGQPFPGEAVGCAMNVFQRSGIRRGETVAIVGIGFLGGVLISLAVEAGARVIALSRRPFALEVARDCGAVETVPISDDSGSLRRVMDLTNGQGCDCVIEAVGLEKPLNLAAELTRERGRLVIAGFHQDGWRQINLQLWNWRGLDVINAHERDPAIYLRGMKAGVTAVSEGRLSLARLLTHHYPIDRLGNALDSMRHRPDGFFKALISL